MVDTKDLLSQINKRFDTLEQGQKQLEQGQARTNKDLQDVKQSQAQTNTSLGQITTAVESIKAGQDDLREKVANLPTRPEFQDFRASVGRKLQDHESRIEEL